MGWGYLAMLGIDSETEVLFISDGADWLWKRVHLVEEVVRDKGSQFHCLLDYYRMKGYLYQMAGAAKGWTKKKQTQWIRRMTKFLFVGDNKAFEREVRVLQMENAPNRYSTTSKLHCLNTVLTRFC